MLKAFKIRISVKLSLILLLVVLLAVVAVGFFAYNQSKNSIEERYLQSLNGVADLKVEKIHTFLSEASAAVRIASELKPVIDFLKKSEKTITTPTTKQNKTENDEDDLESIFNQQPKDTTVSDSQISDLQTNELFINPELENAIIAVQYAYELNNIYLLDKEGRVKYISRSTPEQTLNEYFKVPPIDPNLVVRGRDTIYFSKVALQQIDKEKKAIFYISAPIRDKDVTDNPLVGQIIGEVDMDKVQKLISDKVGLGQTGQVWLLQEQEDRFVYLNSFKTKKREIKIFDKAGDKEDPTTPYIIRRALEKDATHTEAVDESDYLAVSRYISSVEWGVVVKNDKAEIYAPAQALLRRFFVAAIIIILVAVVIGILFSQFLTRPIAVLQKTISMLGRGELPPIITQKSNDEIGEMTEQINQLVKNLEKTAQFAQNIGSKEFDVDFKPLSEKDVLGNALIQAHKELIESAEKTSINAWVNERLNVINDILRTTDKISTMAEKILAYVVREVGAIQGAFYVVKRDEANKDKEEELVMVASYAYNKKKYLSASFKVYKNRYAEGLVGQAAIEKEPIRRTEIPDDYVTITSGLLGEKKPKFLHISPFITADTREVYGVLEIAALEEIPEGSREDELLTRMSDSVARTIFNIEVREKTEKLNEEQRKLNKELEEKRRELEIQAQELREKNIEIEKTNKSLQEQIIKVEQEQRKTAALLENSSEVIIIYNKDKTISYVSPSIKRILGYTAEELQGKNDWNNIEQGRDSFERLFQKLLDYPDERHASIEYLYRTAEGQSIWMEATGSNLIHEPAIQGIVFNTRDITARKIAEREQRLRGQMQALSENSADLILRMDKEGTVYYVNPVIESLTGHPKEVFLEKKITSDYIPQKVLNAWFKLIETSIRNISRGEAKASGVVDFETIEGRKIMSVNAIPERNEIGEIETFLLVSHDITKSEEDKEIIAAANKKITDSINYAKRIQSSILPDTSLLQTIFPDSFVMFKPKDIVSGDFPWLLKTENSVFIAVVDCTGHGVPGALISLIGYFLLNNIFSVEENKKLRPSDILDLLDEAVVRTLKQTEDDAISKDGMDVSLCKIHFDTPLLEYAGAHRPLYYVDTHRPETEDPLEEIKGDKMPVGGGQYKNRGAFTNHQRSYQKGDVIVIFSDGLPDQFGGPDNRKFSPKRIRDIVKANLNLPMIKLHDILENELRMWMRLDDEKNAIKQTDDILVIGIRF